MEKGIKTRITTVTPCHWVPSEMIDALEMALDVDPPIFQLAIDRIHDVHSCCGILDFGPPLFETFGSQPLAPCRLQISLEPWSDVLIIRPLV